MIKVKITNITNNMLTVETFLPVLMPRQTITADIEYITGNMLRLKHNRMILLTQVSEDFIADVTQNETIDNPELLEGDNPQDEVVEIATVSNNKQSRRNKKKNRNRNNNVSIPDSNAESSSENEVKTVAEEVSSEEVTTEEITSEN